MSYSVIDCPKCKAMNPSGAYRCHNCKFDMDSQYDKWATDTAGRGSNPALSAPYSALTTHEVEPRKFFEKVALEAGIVRLRHVVKYYLKDGVVKTDAVKLADELLEMIK